LNSGTTGSYNDKKIKLSRKIFIFKKFHPYINILLETGVAKGAGLQSQGAKGAHRPRRVDKLMPGWSAEVEPYFIMAA